VSGLKSRRHAVVLCLHGDGAAGNLQHRGTKAQTVYGGGPLSLEFAPPPCLATWPTRSPAPASATAPRPPLPHPKLVIAAGQENALGYRFALVVLAGGVKAQAPVGALWAVPACVVGHRRPVVPAPPGFVAQLADGEPPITFLVSMRLSA